MPTSWHGLFWSPISKEVQELQKGLKKETTHWCDIWNTSHLGYRQLCQDPLYVYKTMRSRRASRESFYNAPTNIYLHKMKLPGAGMPEWVQEASSLHSRAHLPLSRYAQVDFHCKLSQIKGDWALLNTDFCLLVKFHKLSSYSYCSQ